MIRPLLTATTLLAACGGSTPTDEKIIPAAPIPGQPAIPYPPVLYNQRIEGEVLLLLIVDSSGSVMRDSTTIVKSSGHSEFDAAAMQAAPTLRFTPAEKNGVHVMAPIQVPIVFTIPDSVKKNRKPSP